ncbi:uncharacterized protein [Dermacentor andersoni]|uniref:uncharacterized protein n=1 Tax=Dermacentor andersoni TaxID=34620 RepID=UPI002155AC21|nr:uncharacterized protein LOC126529149 [Dermacentor andersoni]
MSLSYAFAGLLVFAAMTSTVTASTTTPCVNVTLNNILNISSCLGNSLNFCSGTSTSGLVTGLVKVLTCVLRGVYTYGSPQGIVNALGPLLGLIAQRLLFSSVSLPILGNLSLCGSTSCQNFFLQNDTCQGQITVQLPGLQNVSSCVGDAAMLCTAGSPTTTNQVQSLLQTLTCILRQISLSQLTQVVTGIGCTLLTILSSLAGNASLGTSLQTALGSFSAALRLIVPTCSTTG